MRFGVVILPDRRWADARELWQRAEELGFDHAWTYDHLAWRDLRDGPWFGAVPMLTAAACVTERIRLGALVASPNFRHPVPFAKELITLDDVSGGRFTLGIGAGGTGWDAMVLGHEPWSTLERTERFEEFVELLDLNLREPESSWRGRYYAAVDARTYPGCAQRPRLPFAIAATGPRGMRVAARFGQAWVTTGERSSDEPLAPEQGAGLVRDQIDRLAAACAGVGREASTLDKLVLVGPSLEEGLDSVEAFRESAGRYEEAGVTDLVVHWPRDTEPYRGDVSTFERIFGECL